MTSPEMNLEHVGFRDPTVLTKWTKFFLYAVIPDSILLTWIEIWNPSPGSEEPLVAFAIGLAVLIMMAIPLVAFVLAVIWIHRANQNARQLGADIMAVPPAWPFWRPYRVMKETWRGSANPSDWRGEPISPLLRRWWTSSILWITGIVILEWAWSAGSVTPKWTTAATVPIAVYYILAIPSILFLLAFMRSVHRMQVLHHRSEIGYPAG